MGLEEYEMAASRARKKLARVDKRREPSVEAVHEAISALNDVIEELYDIIAEIDANTVYSSAILADLALRWNLEGLRKEDFEGKYNPGPPARWVLSIPYAPESASCFKTAVGKNIKGKIALTDLWDKLIRQALPPEPRTLFKSAVCCFEFRFEVKTPGRVRDADNCNYVVTPVLNALRRAGVLYDDCDVGSLVWGFPSEKPGTHILVMEVDDPSVMWENLRDCLREEGFCLSGERLIKRFRGPKTLDNAVITPDNA